MSLVSEQYAANTVEEVLFLYQLFQLGALVQNHLNQHTRNNSTAQSDNEVVERFLVTIFQDELAGHVGSPIHDHSRTMWGIVPLAHQGRGVLRWVINCVGRISHGRLL